MKRVGAVVLVTCLATLLATGCDTLFGPSERRTVSVGLYENAPKIYTAANRRPAGLFVEIIDAVGASEGWRINYVRCGWSDCLKQLEEGGIDLMPDVAFSPERAQRLDFHKVSVANSWSQIYVHPDRSVQSLAELDGLRVAILEGGIQQTFLDQLMQSSNIAYEPVLTGTLEVAYQSVLDGRADAVVTNSFFAARNGHKYQLRETPIVFLPSTLYFAAGKGRNSDLLEKIDKHLIEWRRDADSIYFTALYRAMAAPPEVLAPRWVQWSLIGLALGLALFFGVSLLLRRQVEQRTRALLETTRALQFERANLENMVAERTTELVAAKEEAERLTRVKSDFLANMSHEIRTPMNAVLGMLYLAMKEDLPAGLRNHLSKAQGAAHSLLGIINDILDISKIEAGKLDIEHVEFGLDATLEQLADAVGYQTEHKGIEFLIRHDPTIPTHLVGDPLRLGQILLNLCGNAVKFTEKGEVELAFSCLKLDADDITLQISVRDTGIGMSADVQKKLFEKFTQADQTTTRRFGGTGLGLVISKNLVEMMGGRIWIEDSSPGRGTTICFTVRLGIARKAQARQRELVDRAGPLLKGIRVLIVDDNEVSLEILAEMLRFFQIEVATATTGAAAITALQATDEQSAFDLVLMDWRMPGMNGDEAVRRIHGDAQIALKPKIVMITAYGREEVIRLSEQAGVDGFLVKPVSPSTLLDTILTVLGRGRIFGSDDRHRPGTPDLATSGKLAGAHLLLVEDNDINREFAIELLRSEGMLVDEAENGEIALAKVREGHYDGVLMDIQMPVMDGLEAARRIRALAASEGDEHFARLPIIAMTALAMAKDAEESRAAGMNDHVTKPIAPDRLMSVLAKWIHLPDASRIPRQGETAPVRIQHTNTVPDELLALRSLDAGEGIRRIGGKAQSYRKQLRRFRDHYADAITELRRLVAEQGAETAEAHCHALKGVAGNVGATALFEKVSAIDGLLRKGVIPDAAALDEADALLLEVMRDIDSLPTDRDSESDRPAVALTPAQLSAQLKRLAYALEYDLGAVEQLIADLRAGVAGSPLQEAMETLYARIDKFDIDGALALIEQLESAGSEGNP